MQEAPAGSCCQQGEMGTHLLRAGLIFAMLVTGSLLGGLVYTRMRRTQLLHVRANERPNAPCRRVTDGFLMIP